MLSKSNLDTATFEEAIDAHKDSLFRICRIYAADPMEPMDLLQEKSSMGTWLYRVAINVCINTKLKLDRNNDKTVQLESFSFEV
jgi:DNA-directed RNA polymerase specialized sigma24 family protein